MRLALVLILAAFATACTSEPTYHIKPVIEYIDVLECVANDGKAGMVADIDQEGNALSPWLPVCITLVK